MPKLYISDIQLFNFKDKLEMLKFVTPIVKLFNSHE